MEQTTGGKVPVTSHFTLQSTIDKHPAKMQAFVTAIWRATQWLKQHTPEVVFLVFFNTFEGARSIDESFVNAARLSGASEWQITRTVVIPSTMAWVFTSLSPAISFALIGVIVGESSVPSAASAG